MNVSLHKSALHLSKTNLNKPILNDLESSMSMVSMESSQILKKPKIPTIFELAQRYQPKEICKEKEIEFSERKIIIEKGALIEEKDRNEKEKKGRFNERDFEFNGEENIDEFLPPTFQLYNFINITCKSTRDLIDTLKIKGYAVLPSDLRASFKIKDEEKPIMKEKYSYLHFKKIKQKNPNLYKFTRKLKLRSLKDDIINFFQVNTDTLLTISEITKRGEILAKLFMKLNLEETLERMNKEEEERLRLEALEENNNKSPKPNVMTEIPDSPGDKKRGVSFKLPEAINEDEDDSDFEEEINKKNERKESILTQEEINGLLTRKQLELATNMTVEQIQKIGLINQNYQSVINYFDNKVLECFNEEKYEDCIFLKEKKEEFVRNIKDNLDYESLLRTLVIYKLNNNIL